MLRVGICQFLRALYALAASYMAGKWAVGYTFQERGYDAVGSEYVFALAIYLIVFQASGFLFGKIKKREVLRSGGQKDTGNIIVWYDRRENRGTAKKPRNSTRRLQAAAICQKDGRRLQGAAGSRNHNHMVLKRDPADRPAGQKIVPMPQHGSKQVRKIGKYKRRSWSGQELQWEGEHGKKQNIT